MSRHLEIFFDGSCRNDGTSYTPMGIGVAAFVDGKEYATIAKYVGKGTNNVAEWHACIWALHTAVEYLKRYPDTRLSIYSDSQIIAYQYNGVYAVKKAHFVEHYQKSRKYAGQLPSGFKITWIPREKNKAADKLSKEGSAKSPPHTYKERKNGDASEES